jgi:hypothetical protein
VFQNFPSLSRHANSNTSHILVSKGICNEAFKVSLTTWATTTSITAQEWCHNRKESKALKKSRQQQIWPFKTNNIRCVPVYVLCQWWMMGEKNNAGLAFESRAVLGGVAKWNSYAYTLKALKEIEHMIKQGCFAFMDANNCKVP